MAEIRARLHGLRPIAEKILSLSGSAGASIGVLHRGEVIATENFGFRDHALQETATANTLYNVGSLTKAMVAQAASVVVDEGLLSWDTPVSSVIPECPSMGQCTLIDLLSHRSGLPTANVLWYQGGSQPLVEKQALLPIVNAMSPAFPLRSSWRYSNWGYALVGELLERVTGEPWQVILKKRLWDPLGLQRTTTDAGWKRLPNVAQGFMALEDASLYPVDAQAIDDSTVVGAAGGVCSSINELLRYYHQLMRSYRHQANSESSQANLEQVPTVFSSHAVFPYPSPPAYADSTYTLGWVRTRLPSALGLISDNSGLVARMPIVGRGGEMGAQPVFYHQGTTAGFYSSVYLIPETETGVIVLVNTKPLCDSSDWIAQLYLDSLCGDSSEPIDFIALTEESVRTNNLRFSRAEQTLSKERVLGTIPMPLEVYCGRYYWGGGVFFIDIEREDEGELQLVIQGRTDQRYRLRHYHYHAFTWLMTNDEEARRGRFIQATYTYKLVFHCNELQVVDGFTWQEIGGGKALFKRQLAA